MSIAVFFSGEDSWTISHNEETGFVSGIEGSGNEVFESIKDSINKYLGNNSGSVIDFHLLKDAVDRHCDSVEDDVHTLTPIPLYCGLSGTMAGVIIGLYSLLDTGSITSLLSSGSGDFGTAAIGVNDLLAGVAWAMMASIFGIIFTTCSSVLFKHKKIQGETGKNTFLAWLQSKLLPELPTDTSDALNRLVKNLNDFNCTFAENTTELRGALKDVNESYRIQADVIQAVHEMDVMKMAKANVQVLKELKECTDKLEQFNLYLSSVQGYTEAIHKFTRLFEQESERLHVLEEIQRFFTRHKEEIVKETADVDASLRDALRTLKEAAYVNSAELNKALTDQVEAFKSIIKDEKEAFEKANNDLKTQFSTELSHIPMLGERLSEISLIPSRLDKLIDRMESSNASLASEVQDVINRVVKMNIERDGNLISGKGPVPFPCAADKGFPKWMRWTIVISAIIVAVACLANTICNIWFN